MSRSHISTALREAVAQADEHRCSYCQTAESITGSLFTIDHIVPESLGGATEFGNLCLACWSCNVIKQDRIVAIDPITGETVRLFNKRSEGWEEHFCWEADGLLIVGLTPTGRATLSALRLNRPALVNARRLWIKAGWHPPAGIEDS